jgi:hypothetical protein
MGRPLRRRADVMHAAIVARFGGGVRSGVRRRAVVG